MPHQVAERPRTTGSLLFALHYCNCLLEDSTFSLQRAHTETCTADVLTCTPIPVSRIASAHTRQCGDQTQHAFFHLRHGSLSKPQCRTTSSPQDLNPTFPPPPTMYPEQVKLPTAPRAASHGSCPAARVFRFNSSPTRRLQ